MEYDRVGSFPPPNSVNLDTQRPDGFKRTDRTPHLFHLPSLQAIDALVAQTLTTAQPSLAHKYASATSSRADADSGDNDDDSAVDGASDASGTRRSIGGRKTKVGSKVKTSNSASSSHTTMGGTGSIKSRCFQILGFDVMLDSKFKPWLIEINHGPSMVRDYLHRVWFAYPLMLC